MNVLRVCACACYMHFHGAESLEVRRGGRLGGFANSLLEIFETGQALALIGFQRFENPLRLRLRQAKTNIAGGF